MSDDQEPETGEPQVPEGLRDAIAALLQEAKQPKPAPREFPPDEQRLGDRKPEFRKLSDKVAEANRRAGGVR